MPIHSVDSWSGARCCGFCGNPAPGDATIHWKCHHYPSEAHLHCSGCRTGFYLAQPLCEDCVCEREDQIRQDLINDITSALAEKADDIEPVDDWWLGRRAGLDEAVALIAARKFGRKT